jgi:hypothetical protein
MTQHALHAAASELARIVDGHHHVDRPRQHGLSSLAKDCNVFDRIGERVFLQLDDLRTPFGAGTTQHTLQERPVEDVRMNAVVLVVIGYGCGQGVGWQLPVRATGEVLAGRAVA